MVEVQAAAGTQLLLIRHGETQWNLDQRVQGHHDVPLTERGIEQAERLRAALGAESLHAVYSSDLQRARVTAEILAGERLPLHTEPRFRESCFGLFEGLTGTECELRYPEEYQAWRRDSVRHRPPGGETLEDLQRRCLEALREHLPKHGGETVAVVAHGGPVRAMVCGVLGMPLEMYPRIRVENTSVARVIFTARGPILAGLNDVCHLKTSSAAPGHTGWEER